MSRSLPRGIPSSPLLLLALGALLAPSLPTAGAEGDLVNPFADAAGRFRIGTPVRLRGAIVVPLRLRPGLQPGLDAHVGLQDAKAEILQLPGPAGEWHVRIANHENRPLLVPSGETLLTPAGPSRSTDRPVWIAPHTATFVPVFQVTQQPPAGPYVSRGRGLTPFEQAQLDLNRLQQRVRFRNARMGGLPHRRDDAAGAYVTPLFQSILNEAPPSFRDLADGHEVVGVLVADNRGPHFAHIEFDAARFRAHWPFLRDGILLDARLIEDAGLAPTPNDASELRAIVVDLLRALQAKPLNRPNFGVGWQYRWTLSAQHARWDGLAVPDGPVCATLQRNAPLPAGAPPAPGTPGGGGGGPGVGEDGGPGIAELERRLRPTVFEERLRDRRDDLLGRNAPGRARPGGARGKPGGVNPRGPAAPTTPRAPVPSPNRPGSPAGGKGGGGSTGGGSSGGGALGGGSFGGGGAPSGGGGAPSGGGGAPSGGGGGSSGGGSGGGGFSGGGFGSR